MTILYEVFNDCGVCNSNYAINLSILADMQVSQSMNSIHLSFVIVLGIYIPGIF